MPGVFCDGEIAVMSVRGDVRRLIGEVSGDEIEVGIYKTFLLPRADETYAYIEGRRVVRRIVMTL